MVSDKLKLAASVIVICVLMACNVQKKQVERMQTYAIRYPDQFKILANKLEPCFDGTSKSDTVVKIDTTILPGDTITNIQYKKDTVLITKTIQLPGKTVNKTVTIRDTVKDMREKSAFESYYKIKSDSLVVINTQLIQTKSAKSTWMWIALGCMAVILVYGVIKIYTFVKGGAIKSLFK